MMMYFKKSTKDGYRRETWFEEMVVEPEVGEITITSSELEVPRGRWNKHRTRLVFAIGCLSRTIDVIHSCRKIETLLTRRF